MTSVLVRFHHTNDFLSLLFENFFLLFNLHLWQFICHSLKQAPMANAEKKDGKCRLWLSDENLLTKFVACLGNETERKIWIGFRLADRSCLHDEVRVEKQHSFLILNVHKIFVTFIHLCCDFVSFRFCDLTKVARVWKWTKKNVKPLLPIPRK